MTDNNFSHITMTPKATPLKEIQAANPRVKFTSSNVVTEEWEGFLWNEGEAPLCLEKIAESHEKWVNKKTPHFTELRLPEDVVLTTGITLQEALDAHKRWLSNPRTGARFVYGGDLSGINLRNLNLSKSVLAGAVLSESDLSYTDFSNATMTDSDLVRAVIRNTNFQAASLRFANMAGADASYAIFSFAKLDHANMFKVNLGSAIFGGTSMEGTDLLEASLSSTQFNYVDLRLTCISGAEIFTTTSFTGSLMRDSLFIVLQKLNS
jgi:uncharacterized protein YjbI with pentapeptide repeats